MNLRTARGLLVVACFALFCPLLSHAATSASGCVQKFPDELSEKFARCIFEWADIGGSTASRSELTKALIRYPDAPWLRFYLAHFKMADQEAALSEFETIENLFQENNDQRGITAARIRKINLLQTLNRVDEAKRELGAVESRVRLVNDNDIEFYVDFLVEKSKIQMNEGVELEALYRDFLAVEKMVLPSGEPACHTFRCLAAFGSLCHQVGKLEDAQRVFEQFLQLAREQNKDWDIIVGTINVAITEAERLELTLMPRQRIREKFISRIQEVYDIAVALRHYDALSRFHRYRAWFSDNEARPELEKCVEFAKLGRRKDLLIRCYYSLAAKLADDDSEQARSYLERAQKLASESKDILRLLHGWPDALEAEWRLLARDEAIHRATTVLELVERLRDQQFATGTRVSLFSVWTHPYYWLAGRLLQGENKTVTFEDSSRAFAIAERLRARVMLDELARARATPQPLEPDHPLQRERTRIVNSLIDAQQRLFMRGIDNSDRMAAAVEIENLEHAADAIANEMTRKNPAYAILERPRFTSLMEVQASLGPAAAMLTAQVAPRYDLSGHFAGGSWLLAITHSDVTTVELPERRELHARIQAYLGLLPRRDEGEVRAARGVFDELLGATLPELPSEVDHLLIVPDGHLALLPFAALSPDGEGRLIERFKVSVLPSASWWHQVRTTTRKPTGEEEILIFADPTLKDENGEVPQALRDAWSDVEGLDPLPNARAEGKAVCRRLGRPCRLLVGGDASESRLATADLSRVGILHVAAHALVDEDQPDRSAVILGAGDDEDGALQIREIVELDLDGKIVVLSACSSATGKVLSGEGVMSLARAFFQAGAIAVVGSLWPLRDEAAAELFDRVYRHLGRGESLAGALQAAQRELLDDGVPAADWAGVQVFGDGAIVPFPDGRAPAFDPFLLALWAGLVIFAALAFTVVLRRWLARG